MLLLLPAPLLLLGHRMHGPAGRPSPMASVARRPSFESLSGNTAVIPPTCCHSATVRGMP